MSAPVRPLGREVTFELLPPPEESGALAMPVPVRVWLRYDPADPFAVHATFHTGGQEPVRWVFSRELLAAGLAGPAGIGDVRVHPLPEFGPVDGERGQRIVLELSTPSGHAVFATDADAVGEFLRATYRLVPEGTELGHLELDAELAALLAEGPQ
jgi:hypothetical protein